MITIRAADLSGRFSTNSFTLHITPVHDPVVIVEQPQNVIVPPGGTARFDVRATGGRSIDRDGSELGETPADGFADGRLERRRETRRGAIGVVDHVAGEDDHGRNREEARDFDRGFRQVRREEPRIGRNDPCPCGSGKKYKKCCGAHAA